MIKLKESKIFNDNKEILILSGEVHYYRLKKKYWQKTLDNLKEAGCNCVATYIPWIIHEYNENDFDFSGIYHEENDLISFLKLVKENDLFLIARPGPFVMAEMKNEGIPYWVFEKDKDILPKTWDERITYNKTCDYSNIEYLKCVKHWYEHIIPILAPYEMSSGGNMIMLQLDNEVGMLSWVCNCPDLTDTVCCDFIRYLNVKYGLNGVLDLYGTEINNELIRSPKEDFALIMHNDLGEFMRIRSLNYFNNLKEYINELGINKTPLTFNIHGSGGNRATNYPIGISQLYEVFKSDNNYLPGSDMYIGNVGIGNFQDLYIANVFARSVSNSSQPLTAMEFEGCAGDYDNNFDNLTEPQAIDIKTRLYIALGNKMLNLYLFSGGENYRIDRNLHDGNGRIAITGQRHGYKAPVDYMGDKNIVFDSVKNVITLMQNNSFYLADTLPYFDNVKVGFIPDYYMTEFHYPKSSKQINLHNEIKLVRDNGALNVISRSLILTNHSFDAVNLEDENCLNKLGNDVLVVTSTKYMDKVIQERIIKYINAGNNVLIYGFLPEYDMKGNSCCLLKEFLKVDVINDFRDLKYNVKSVYPTGRYKNHYEIRCGIGQTLDVDKLPNCEVIMREYETNECVGFLNEYGKSRVCVITNYYHCNLEMFTDIFNWLEINRKINYIPKYYGTYASLALNNNLEGYINIFDLDGYRKEEYLYIDNKKVFKNKIILENKKCAMLPYNLKIDDNFIIEKASAELFKVEDDYVLFRPIQDITEIYLIRNGQKEEFVFNDLDIIKISR